MTRLVAPALVLVLAACNTGPTKVEPVAEPAPTTTATTAEGRGELAPREGVLRLGAPIEASAQKVSLADVAKAPDSFTGKTFTTTGTVTAVCQHMGCWMEIKDDASEAHIKMAGHAFFVPKTASGRKARVLATLVKGEDEACAGEDGEGKMAAMGGSEKPGSKKGCKAEAEAQLGRPLAKLELVAQGVELL